MRRALSFVFVIAVLSAGLVAQDSTSPQETVSNQPPAGGQSSTPASQAADTMTEMPAPDPMPAASTSSASDSSTSNPRSYGSGGSSGYGSRAEVFLTGFGLFTNSANGNGITQQATMAGGVSAGYRFHFNSWSAIEGRYGFSHNSQKYTIGGAVSSIPAYLSEITGSYIYSFPKLHGLQPFLEGGGGIVRLSPGNYSSGSSTSSGGPTGGGGGGYSAALLGTASATTYSGSTAGIGAQIRPAFAYGIGLDFPAFTRLSLRAEYRGLGYKAPDFKIPALQTNAFNVLSEPSFGVVFHF